MFKKKFIKDKTVTTNINDKKLKILQLFHRKKYLLKINHIVNQMKFLPRFYFHYKRVYLNNVLQQG